MDNKDNKAMLNKVTPKNIDIDFILAKKQAGYVTVEKAPIIPNITIPEEMIYKPPSVGDPLAIEIRGLFNALTSNNISEIKESAKQAIISKAKTEESLSIIAQEILGCLTDTENNIDLYFPILSFIHTSRIEYPNLSDSKPKYSKTLAYFFLMKCRDQFISTTDEKTVRDLAKLDIDIVDQRLKYNEDRAKVFNLIAVICRLYNQRKDIKSLRLNHNQLYEVIDKLLSSHNDCQTKMKQLGDPFNDDEECKDEDEFMVQQKMAHIYAEYIYVFIENSKDIINDHDPIAGDPKPTNLASLVTKYKNDVIPKISESYLRAKCQALGL
jgi:hypothetical protein